MLGNQLLNSVPGFEENLNRLKMLDFVYTTCEAGKRRSVNPALASPTAARRAVGEAVARRGRTSDAVRGQCDVMC